MKKITDVLTMIQEGTLSSFFEKLVKEKKVGSFIAEMAHYDQPDELIGQNPIYHDRNVPYHVLGVMRTAEAKHPGNEVHALAALLHDIGKLLKGVRGTNKKGQPNDIGHEAAGVPLAEAVLKRIGASESVKKDVLFLVEMHGLTIASSEGGTPRETVEKFSRKTLCKLVKKIVPFAKNQADLIRLMDLLFEFKLLDASGFNKEFAQRQTETIEYAKPRFLQIIEEENFFEGKGE